MAKFQPSEKPNRGLRKLPSRRRVTPQADPFEAKANLSSARTSSDAGPCVSHHNSSASSLQFPGRISPAISRQPMAARRDTDRQELSNLPATWCESLPLIVEIGLREGEKSKATSDIALSSAIWNAGNRAILSRHRLIIRDIILMI